MAERAGDASEDPGGPSLQGPAARTEEAAADTPTKPSSRLRVAPEARPAAPLADTADEADAERPLASAEAHSRRVKARMAALAALVLAVPLLGLGIPYTLSAFAALPGNYVIDRLRAGDRVDRGQLDTLIVSREQALAWWTSGALLTDLALARMVEAEMNEARGAPADPAAYGAAAELLEQGLARAPARPFAWTRLAFARFRAEAPLPEVIEALRLSFATAPYDPRLRLPRLELLLASWPALDEEMVAIAERQIAEAWIETPEDLAALVARGVEARPVRRVLLRDLASLTAFERMVKTAEAAIAEGKEPPKTREPRRASDLPDRLIDLANRKPSTAR